MTQQKSEFLKQYLENGNTIELQAVLDQTRIGIDDFIIVEEGHNSKTMLIYAVQHAQSVSTVEFLLKNGADPRVKDFEGLTALHHACLYGNRDQDMQTDTKFRIVKLFCERFRGQ